MEPSIHPFWSTCVQEANVPVADDVILSTAARRYQKPLQIEVHVQGKAYCFTRRESQTMVLMCRGLTLKQSADILQLSARTVEYYLDSVKQKLRCRSRAEAIVFFSRQTVQTTLRHHMVRDAKHRLASLTSMLA